jgi:polyhydroxybutyrate depolymerase
MRHATLWLTLMSVLVASTAAADCNGESSPCKLPNGTYHIVLPEGVTGPVPAILLLGTIRNKGMVNLMLGRGYAVIAPDGQPRDNGDGRSWDFHPDRPATRDETAFLIAVADDAAKTYNLQRDEMLLAGFSIGGSMTSYVACQAPEAFAAYAPVAGSFWLPQPTSCAGPVRILHTHGKADRTVPLLGREIMPGFVQGNVFKAMETWRLTNDCPSAEADETVKLGIYEVQHWTDCQPGTDLRFALHEGGHSIPKGWAQMAVDWFETR